MKELILAIESSCDDSSIAVISRLNYKCLFHKKISQELAHSNYGGVVPELAARLHSEALPEILTQCKGFFGKLCAIAVTNEPGLSVSLLGGITMARVLSASLKIPLIAINHLKGHIYSLFLNEKVKLDMGILLVSGGHTMVLKITPNGEIIELARSSDDSFGESFDKVAKMIGFGYPGGQVIEKLAFEAKEKNVNFKIPLINSKELAFSFSGLKNAVRLELLRREKFSLNQNDKAEIAFGFQKTACAHILNKLEKVFEFHSFKHFGVVGGASANLTLRDGLSKLCERFSCTLRLAPLEFCADNALMIARAGVDAYEKGEFVSIDENILSPKSRFLSRI